MANACTRFGGAVAKNIFVYMCDQNLGAVRSINLNLGTTLADISSITDERVNNVAVHDTATGSIEIVGLPNGLVVDGSPASAKELRGVRGLLEVIQGGDPLNPLFGEIYYSEYVVIESVDVAFTVGDSLVYTINVNTAVAPDDES